MKILRYWRPADLPPGLVLTPGSGPTTTVTQDSPSFENYLSLARNNPDILYTVHEQTETLLEERRTP